MPRLPPVVPTAPQVFALLCGVAALLTSFLPAFLYFLPFPKSARRTLVLDPYNHFSIFLMYRSRSLGYLRCMDNDVWPRGEPTYLHRRKFDSRSRFHLPTYKADLWFISNSFTPSMARPRTFRNLIQSENMSLFCLKESSYEFRGLFLYEGGSEATGIWGEKSELLAALC